MSLDTFRFLAARSLERGVFRSALGERLSAEWARRAEVARPVVLPAGARVIGVGGPTLGGSYKTPFVLALGRAFAERKQSVAVACHAYRTRTARARRVSPSDIAADVGDDALLLARALEEASVPVFCGARRPELLALSAASASVVISDALLQTRPERLALSVLLLDRYRPWGTGRCPPEGDLRAAPERLAEAADVLGVVTSKRERAAENFWGDPEVDPLRRADPLALPGRSTMVNSRLFGAENGRGERLSLGELAGLRTGLALAVARPERIVRSLAAEGISPFAVRFFADHATPEPPRWQRSQKVDVWLTSAKCATKLGDTFGGAPLFVIDHRLELARSFVDGVLSRIKHESPNS